MFRVIDQVSGNELQVPHQSEAAGCIRSWLAPLSAEMEDAVSHLEHALEHDEPIMHLEAHLGVSVEEHQEP